MQGDIKRQTELNETNLAGKQDEQEKQEAEAREKEQQERESKAIHDMFKNFS